MARNRYGGKMGDKILKNLIMPYLKVNTVALFILATILLYFNVWVGLIAFVFIALLFLSYRRTLNEQKKLAEIYVEGIVEGLSDTLNYSVTNHPLPLCMIDSNGTLTLFNSKFKEIYENAEALITNISQLTGVKNPDFFTEDMGEKPVQISKGDKTYKVLSSYLNEDKSKSAVLYWIEVSNYEKLKVLYNEERTCFAYVNVDNYDELLSSSPEESRSVLAAEIEKIIRQWALKISASLTRYKENQYFIVFEQKHYEKLEANKFSILDEIREIETAADFPVSLSMGIGLGGKNPSQQDEYAAIALDLALGRGGDQAVVKRGNKIEYYGGRLQTVEKRNKGKSRIMAHALKRLIDQSSKIIIMGHKRPDMDCFGAGLGVNRLAKNRSRDSYIVLNSYNDSLRQTVERAKGSDHCKFLSNEEALSVIDKDTLLIVVDTHRPSMVECAGLLSKTDKIVIIDHHRKAEEFIENAILIYMEAYASSTSELITEILQYASDKKDIDKFEAEALLAGIIVDTNRFSIKTGVRTFEAASWLRRMGADTASVRQVFQTDLDDFKTKAEIISNAMVLGSRRNLKYKRNQR
ncbi:MAG: DHH family phosphoesterase [Anaerovorax sp.]